MGPLCIVPGSWWANGVSESVHSRRKAVLRDWKLLSSLGEAKVLTGVQVLVLLALCVVAPRDRLPPAGRIRRFVGLGLRSLALLDSSDARPTIDSHKHQ